MNLNDMIKKLEEANAKITSGDLSTEELKKTERKNNNKNPKRIWVTVVASVFLISAVNHASNTPSEQNKGVSESVSVSRNINTSESSSEPFKTQSEGYYTSEFKNYSKQDITNVPTKERNAMVVAMDSSINEKVQVATYMLMLDAKGYQKGIATKEDMTKEGISFNEYKQALDGVSTESRSEIQSHNVGQMWTAE